MSVVVQCGGRAGGRGQSTWCVRLAREAGNVGHIACAGSAQARAGRPQSGAAAGRWRDWCGGGWVVDDSCLNMLKLQHTRSKRHHSPRIIRMLPPPSGVYGTRAHLPHPCEARAAPPTCVGQVVSTACAPTCRAVARHALRLLALEDAALERAVRLVAVVFLRACAVRPAEAHLSPNL